MCSYAVRGPVLDVAAKLEQRLQKGEALPFSSIIYCNIGTTAERPPPHALSRAARADGVAAVLTAGNPQSLKQQPLTYIRQVLSLVLNPSLLKDAPKGLVGGRQHRPYSPALS